MGAGNTPRIRFPQVQNGSAVLPNAIYMPGTSVDWPTAAITASSPWASPLQDLETPQELGECIASIIRVLVLAMVTTVEHVPKGLALPPAWDAGDVSPPGRSHRRGSASPLSARTHSSCVHPPPLPIVVSAPHTKIVPVRCLAQL